MIGIIMLRIIVFFSLLLATISSHSLEIRVNDYYYSPEEGLFYTRLAVDEDIVYHIPPLIERFVDTNQSEMIDGELFSLYEVTVGFSNDVDTDVVRDKTPAWSGYGFLRDSVVAEEFCRVGLESSANFVFFQSINSVWEREGSVLSSELIFCQMRVAIRPSDTFVLEDMQELAGNNQLISKGIESFDLIVDDLFNGDVSLTNSFNFLQNVSNSGIDELNESQAIVALGAAFESLFDHEFDAVISSSQRNTQFLYDLLDRFFSVSDDTYLIKSTLDDDVLSFYETVNIDITR